MEIEAYALGVQERETTRHIDRTYSVDLVDDQGVVHASVEKVIYVKRKEGAAGG